MSPVNLTTSAWQASQPNQQSGGPKICQSIAFTGDYILSDLSSQVNQNSQTRVPMYTIAGSAISGLVLCLYIWREFYYMALFRNNKPKRLWAASSTSKGSHHWAYFTASREEKRPRDCLRAMERRWVVRAGEENVGPHTCPQDHISQLGG